MSLQKSEADALWSESKEVRRVLELADKTIAALTLRTEEAERHVAALEIRVRDLERMAGPNFREAFDAAVRLQNRGGARK